MWQLILDEPVRFILALIIGIGTGWWIWARMAAAKAEAETAQPARAPAPEPTPTPAPTAAPEPAPAPEPVPEPEPIAPLAAAGAAAAVSADESGDDEGPKPAIAAAVGESDDLTRIKGVGPKLNELCLSLGVRRFDQIAAWSAADVAEVDQYLKIKGRIDRDRWVDQAKLLAAGDDAGHKAEFG